MDSGSQWSVPESLEENELTPEKVLQADYNTTTSNFSGSHKNGYLNSDNGIATLAAANEIPPDSGTEKECKSGEPVNSPSPAVNSPADATPTTKGYGLKKWRRIRRDFQKDSNATVDSNKVLKRLLPTPANPNRALHNIEALVGSTGGIIRFDGTSNCSAAQGSSLNSRFAAVPSSVAAADSDNSDDRSRKSSRAASALRFSSDLPSGSGYTPKINGIKNVSSKNLSSSAKGTMQGKSRVESTKKQRGERMKIEKEKSHPNLGLDSRSSDFSFTQANFSVTINGKSGNYDGLYGDDAKKSEPQFDEEVQTGHSKQKVEFDGCSQDDSAAEMPWKVRKEKQQNHHPSTDFDPLVESILSLQSVHETLERELQKFVDIAEEPLSPPSINSSSPLHDQVHLEKISDSPPSFLDMQVLTLTENVKNLEVKLEKARATLQVREAQVSELEAAVSQCKLPEKETGSKGGESELEGLFRQKIEAEIEYLVMTSMVQKLRVEEQRSLADVQSSMINKLGKVEAKAVVLKKQAEEEADNLVSGDVRGVDEVLRFHSRTCKALFYLILQLLLLLVLCWLFVLRLSPESAFSMPT